MKNFQQNLLIILALALCVLCALQWREQTVQRNEIIALNGMASEKNVAIQDATNSVAVRNHQIEQLDARLAEVKAGAMTNELLMASQKAELVRLQLADASLTNEVVQYKAAVAMLESKLNEAYAGIGKQNETITNLVIQRDGLVQKYNGSVKDRNEIVGKYNELVGQMQKRQDGWK